MNGVYINPIKILMILLIPPTKGGAHPKINKHTQCHFLPHTLFVDDSATCGVVVEPEKPVGTWRNRASSADMEREAAPGLYYLTTEPPESVLAARRSLPSSERRVVMVSRW